MLNNKEGGLDERCFFAVGYTSKRPLLIYGRCAECVTAGKGCDAKHTNPFKVKCKFSDESERRDCRHVAVFGFRQLATKQVSGSCKLSTLRSACNIKQITPLYQRSPSFCRQVTLFRE